MDGIPAIDGLSPLAARLLIDAAYLHESAVYVSAHKRAIDGSYPEYGPLSTHKVEDAAREMRDFVDGLVKPSC